MNVHMVVSAKEIEKACPPQLQYIDSAYMISSKHLGASLVVAFTHTNTLISATAESTRTIKVRSESITFQYTGSSSHWSALMLV
ncbi:hypothetical protein BaRGS_00005320 [Batillaria attramentaria]|uniref:Uncharacterized protein n=1 Tax=Batillaria attramentaria TaxID=370345 RepID=A0ABD0LUY0_9CAEN